METETDRRRLRARRNLVDMNAASNEVKRVHAAAAGRARFRRERTQAGRGAATRVGGGPP